MQDYFKVEDGQVINSIQDLYLTYKTSMIDYLDDNTYNKMMIEVCKDILKNDEIVKTIKKLSRKHRLFLGPIIYEWAKDEWHNQPLLPQPTYAQTGTRSFLGRTYNMGAQTSNPYNDFVERFEEAFHPEILRISKYKYRSQDFGFSFKFEDNKYDISMFVNKYKGAYDKIGRMIARYDEEKNNLYVSYIENIMHKGKYVVYETTPQYFRTELFRGLRMVMDVIEENGKDTPTVTCKKKFNKLLNDANKLRYLEKPKEEE